ncbi:hypothetical protein ABKN59_011677 [Abortiporus biennis]
MLKIRLEARTEFDSENVEFETTLLANDEQFGLKVERSTFKLCIHQVAASLQASSFKSQMLSNPGFHCHSPQEFSLFHVVSILSTWRDSVFLHGLGHGDGCRFGVHRCPGFALADARLQSDVDTLACSGAEIR